MRPLLLASSSPRRRELLALGGWTFQVRPAHVDETTLPGEDPAAYVQRLSVAKARWVGADAPDRALVIGADTVVVLDDHIIGKPVDANDALRILESLRGRVHEVFTGLTVLDTATRQAHTQLARSRVPMRHYGDEEVRTYIATGDPLDKAGAYAIQHAGFQPVDAGRFADCFANVMGLPLCHLLRQLRCLNVDSFTDLPAACQQFIPYDCPVFERILKEDPC